MVRPETAPVPGGPFAIGKIIETGGAGTWGYTSGQIGRCPKTGDFVSQEPGPQAA